MPPSGKKQAVTILDIARLAGVSPSTVSRILNGTVAVAPEKTAAVMEVVERLNYRPNVVAQGLVRGTSSTVGVMTQHLGSPFFGEMLRGIETGLSDSNYYPVIASGRWVGPEEIKALHLLMSRRVDAVIVLGGEIPNDYLIQTAEEMPVVVVGRMVEGLEQQCISINNVEAAYKATSYLINMGHDSIAHITGMLTHGDAVERREGYERALREAGIKIDPKLVVEGIYTEQSGLLAVEHLMSSKKQFTAVFAANDQLAAGARLGLYRRGLRVPDDISLIGFDDQAGSAFMTPPLTTVRHPSYEMGIAAARVALALLTDRPLPDTEVPIELVIRESVKKR